MIGKNQTEAHEIHNGKRKRSLPLSIALSTIQVTVQFSPFPPTFEGEHPRGGQGLPTPLPQPHARTCGSTEPRPYGTAVSVADLYTRWTIIINSMEINEKT
ncbi:hypothetical protein TNCV_2113281 [Trichonephila clavipes]|nr:hypothetical protein TNCV_2113281 [Trichonephila clavipes]